MESLRTRLNWFFSIDAREKSVKPFVQFVSAAVIHNHIELPAFGFMLIKHVINSYRIAIVLDIHSQMIEFVIERNSLMFRSPAALHEKMQEYKRIIEIAIECEKIID